MGAYIHPCRHRSSRGSCPSCPPRQWRRAPHAPGTRRQAVLWTPAAPPPLTLRSGGRTLAPQHGARGGAAACSATVLSARRIMGLDRRRAVSLRRRGGDAMGADRTSGDAVGEGPRRDAAGNAAGNWTSGDVAGDAAGNWTSGDVAGDLGRRCGNPRSSSQSRGSLVGGRQHGAEARPRPISALHQGPLLARSCPQLPRHLLPTPSCSQLPRHDARPRPISALGPLLARSCSQLPRHLLPTAFSARSCSPSSNEVRPAAPQLPRHRRGTQRLVFPRRTATAATALVFLGAFFQRLQTPSLEDEFLFGLRRVVEAGRAGRQSGVPDTVGGPRPRLKQFLFGARQGQVLFLGTPWTGPGQLGARARSGLGRSAAGDRWSIAIVEIVQPQGGPVLAAVAKLLMTGPRSPAVDDRRSHALRPAPRPRLEDQTSSTALVVVFVLPTKALVVIALSTTAFVIALSTAFAVSVVVLSTPRREHDSVFIAASSRSEDDTSAAVVVSVALALCGSVALALCGRKIPPIISPPIHTRRTVTASVIFPPIHMRRTVTPADVPLLLRMSTTRRARCSVFFTSDSTLFTTGIDVFVPVLVDTNHYLMLKIHPPSHVCLPVTTFCCEKIPPTSRNFQY